MMMRCRIGLLVFWVLAAPVCAADLPVVLREAPPCIVLVTAPLNADGTRAAFAGGVVLAQTRDALTIVTAAHVPNLERGQVLTQRGEMLAIRSVRVLAGRDVALLTTDPARDRYPAPVVASVVLSNAPAYVWGYPSSATPTLSTGRTIAHPQALATKIRPDEITMICATCGHGDSGGGIFTSDGKLVGIVTHGFVTRSGVPAFVVGEPLDAAIAAIP